MNAKEDKISLVRNTKGPLFEQHVNLKCYPIEFIFAEKLETILYRGADNSRMKDFHDLYTLISTKQLLQQEPTYKTIQAVFCHRKTPLKPPSNLLKLP